MTNPLFEKAKQAVAERHGHKTWNSVVYLLIETNYQLPKKQQMKNRELFRKMESFAADLYGQWVTNEAVKADRESAISELMEIHTRIEVIRVDDLRLFPLPFPQQPDGR